MSNTCPTSWIWPVIGHGVGLQGRLGDGDRLATLGPATPIQLATMTRPCSPWPSKGKQTSDAARDRIKFDTSLYSMAGQPFGFSQAAYKVCNIVYINITKNHIYKTLQTYSYPGPCATCGLDTPAVQ